MKSCAFMLLIGPLLSLSSCGGSGSTPPPPSTTYTIGGTISGLSGTGLVLQNNAGDNLSVSANGAFTFTMPMASGGAYKVTVLTQPSDPSQTCTVSSGSGNATAKVTGVQVACASAVTYTIGGTVSDLTGTGLVLQDNGGDNLPVSANGGFTFVTPIASGAKYNVTVFAQPTAQNCVVTGGAATVTANVTNVQVSCTNVATYTIGGTVSNLIGTGLVLQNNGADNLVVTANGAFTFATQIATGSKYKVTVLTQPTKPSETCSATNGSGTATANVTSVVISCNSAPNEWTWVNGADSANQSGTYGTLGTADPANVPGARGASVAWTDASSNLWLFGGYGLDSSGFLSYLNDLWEYSAGEWTWVGGSNVINQRGTYGTLGTADPSNIPGAREFAASSVDSNGDLWLFGGWGFDAPGSVNVLNDLWKYSAGEWTWESGSDSANQQGTYGTLGTAAPGNVPGARQYAVTWIDSAGNLWLFGGWGEDSAGNTGDLNDLWKFRTGEWTWMGGSNVVGHDGVYGTLGMSGSGNFPGARQYAVGWTDTSGNFWLFGGYGYGSSGSPGVLDDLWKYSAGEWTWESGSSSVGQPGIYGTIGISAPANAPGGRGGASAWIDTNKNFWLFGGQGLDSKGAYGNLNDLWKYNSGAWTWMNGSDLNGQLGTYGTLGIAGTGNTPGGRYFGVSWPQGAEDLWLLGGFVLDQSSGWVTYFNDLWEYAPSSTAQKHQSEITRLLN